MIQSDYLHYLRRATDPAGLSLWVSEMQHGARHDEVLAAILGSDEYIARA